MFRRLCIMLVFGLDAVVAVASDNLLIVCTRDFSMRLLLDSQREMPSVHRLQHHSFVDTNLICIDRAQFKLLCKSDLFELIRPLLYSQLLSIHASPASHGILDLWEIGQECWYSVVPIHLSFSDISFMR